MFGPNVDPTLLQAHVELDFRRVLLERDKMCPTTQATGLSIMSKDGRYVFVGVPNAVDPTFFFLVRHVDTVRTALELGSDLCEVPTPRRAVAVPWVAAAWMLFTLNFNVGLKGALTAKSIAGRPQRFSSAEV